MISIGVDFGVGTNDIPMFIAVKKEGDKLIIIDSGRIEDFDYSKYIASEHQVVGNSVDLEIFKSSFMEG